MTIELPALSRRTFLRGMGATIAVTSACGAVEYFSILAPLSIALLVDGDSAVGSLRGFINSPLFNPGRVFVSSATLRDRVDKVLRVERPGLPCLDLPSANARSSDLCASIVVLGAWKGIEQQLEPILRKSKAVYVDNPVTAMNLAAGTGSHWEKQRTVVGLTSPVDAAVEGARQLLNSGSVGRISDLAVTVRRGDTVARWEVAGALRRIFDGRVFPGPRIISTVNVSSGVHITGATGKLRVAICSAKERAEMLSACREDFYLAARGEPIPSFSLRDMSSLATEFGGIIDLTETRG